MELKGEDYAASTGRVEAAVRALRMTAISPYREISEIWMAMYRELTPDLPAEYETLKQNVHRFAIEVMRPAAAALDRMSDPRDVAAPDSQLRQVLRAAWGLGYHAAGILRRRLAPQVGFEPTTLRLTAGCSTIELLRNTGRSVFTGGPDRGRPEPQS